jgi:hypothetical protein
LVLTADAVPPILNADAVSNSETERRAQEIIYAFYNHFFSGEARTLGGESVTFKKLEPTNYIFNQQQSTNPKTGPEIHTVVTDARPMQRGNSSSTKTVVFNTILTIYVRVRNPSDGMQSADFESRFWADALKRIFEAPATRPARAMN